MKKGKKTMKDRISKMKRVNLDLIVDIFECGNDPLLTITKGFPEHEAMKRVCLVLKDEQNFRKSQQDNRIGECCLRYFQEESSYTSILDDGRTTRCSYCEKYFIKVNSIWIIDKGKNN